jgi:predicted helicase
LYFDKDSVELCSYRPFNTRWVYRHDDVIHRQCRRTIFPGDRSNTVFVVTDVGSSSFSVLPSTQLFDAAFLSGDGFPLKLHENINAEHQLFSTSGDGEKSAISDWALEVFRLRLSDKKIKKDDIFYYCYGVLSSTEFLEKFEQDARKSGPRVPILKSFHEWAKTGKLLYNLHSNIDQLSTNSNVKIKIVDEKLDQNIIYKVDKIKFGVKTGKNNDKSTIKFNEHILITDIPIEAYSFKVNGRSVVEWVMDQYEKYTDKETGHVIDPNEFDPNPKYIFDLLLKSITLSVKTVEILSTLPQMEYVQ